MRQSPVCTFPIQDASFNALWLWWTLLGSSSLATKLSPHARRLKNRSGRICNDNSRHAFIIPHFVLHATATESALTLNHNLHFSPSLPFPDLVSFHLFVNVAPFFFFFLKTAAAYVDGMHGLLSPFSWTRSITFVVIVVGDREWKNTIPFLLLSVFATGA